MSDFDLGWGDIKNSTSDVNFITLEPGKRGNLMRIVGNPSKLTVHWERSNEDSKMKKIACSGEDCSLCKAGSKVTNRYQVLVIDKKDFNTEDGYGDEGPQIKILETGISVMKAIKDYALEPLYGDPTKYDIKVRKEGTGKDTSYTVIAAPQKSDLTEEEAAAVEKAPTIAELNPVKTNDEILEMNLGIFGNSTSHQKPANADHVSEAPAQTGGSEDKTKDDDWDAF